MTLACIWSVLQLAGLTVAAVKAGLALSSQTAPLSTVLQQTPYAVLPLSLSLYASIPPVLLLLGLILPGAAAEAVTRSAATATFALALSMIALTTIPAFQLMAAFMPDSSSAEG